MQELICWPESETGYIRIKRKDFNRYITEEFLTAIGTWRRIKNYGWPQGRGYLAEPRTVLEMVELFDREKANYSAWKERSDGGNH